jgi:hypothetical protein
MQALKEKCLEPVTGPEWFLMTSQSAPDFSNRKQVDEMLAMRLAALARKAEPENIILPEGMLDVAWDAAKHTTASAGADHRKVMLRKGIEAVLRWQRDNWTKKGPAIS